MSPALIAFVGILYAYVAAEQFYSGNPAMGAVWTGYSLSNFGFWFSLK